MSASDGPPTISELPIFACLRIATLARIGGIAHGIRIDQAYGGLIALSSEEPTELRQQRGRKAALDLWKNSLSPAFMREVGNQCRETLQGSFSLEPSIPSDDFSHRAADSCAYRAMPLFLCASLDPSAWMHCDRLDDRHLSFPDQASAASCMRSLLGATIDKITAAGAEHGILIEPRALLADIFEAEPSCGPCSPNTPFSSIKGGYFQQSQLRWARLADTLASSVESASLRREIQPSKGAPRIRPRI